MGNFLSLESDIAKTRRGKANDGPKKSRFPGSVPAKESNHLPLFNA
jgi:hypothetical protein